MDIGHTISTWLRTASLTLLFCLGHTDDLAAAELISLDVGQDGDTYTVRLEMELAVTGTHVQQVLTNFRQLHRLNPSIVESRILASPENGFSRVFTRLQSCVLFFCSEVTRVEDVYEFSSGDLMAVVVPEQSDFKAGTSFWRITERGDHTLLIYEASMQPGFYIPPMIGSYFVKQKLRDELLVSFNRIECCAGSQASDRVQRQDIC